SGVFGGFGGVGGQVGEPFLRGAEEVGDVHRLAGFEQLPGQGGGRARGRQEGGLGGGEGGAQRLTRVSAVGGKDQGVAPVQADFREGERDRGDGRDDVRRDPPGA